MKETYIDIIIPISEWKIICDFFLLKKDHPKWWTHHDFIILNKVTAI